MAEGVFTLSSVIDIGETFHPQYCISFVIPQATFILFSAWGWPRWAAASFVGHTNEVGVPAVQAPRCQGRSSAIFTACHRCHGSKRNSFFGGGAVWLCLFYFYFFSVYLFYFTILYWFCHTWIWIRHGCNTCSPSWTPSHLPPYTIPLGHPSAPAPSTLYHVLNLDCRFISHMILYMFQCHSPIWSRPRPLPQSPKDCSIHLSLLLSRIQGYHYHLSKFHMYALVYCIGVFLSDLLHSV